jgi:hypothetical protein
MKALAVLGISALCGMGWIAGKTMENVAEQDHQKRTAIRVEHRHESPKPAVPVEQRLDYLLRDGSSYDLARFVRENKDTDPVRRHRTEIFGRLYESLERSTMLDVGGCTDRGADRYVSGIIALGPEYARIARANLDAEGGRCYDGGLRMQAKRLQQ